MVVEVFLRVDVSAMLSRDSLAFTLPGEPFLASRSDEERGGRKGDRSCSVDGIFEKEGGSVISAAGRS